MTSSSAGGSSSSSSSSSDEPGATHAPLPGPGLVVKRKPWYQVLYIQVLIGVGLGILMGYLFPRHGAALEPLGTGFINMVKMIIAPIIFCTVVHGIASMTDIRRLGRIGVKALIYFEVVSTLALIIGLIVVNFMQPGKGMNVNIEQLRTEHAADIKKVAEYAEKSHEMDTVKFIMGIIPKTYISAFTGGDILQVLFVALLTGFAIASLGEKGKPALHVLDHAGAIAFAIMGIIVKAAPLAAFGAMAFTVGKFGIESLGPLVYLMLGFYITAACFVFGVLGTIAWFAGFSIFKFVYYIRDEILLVLGTSSSETALPGMMEKTRRLGCAESTVGFVIPTGYSFNLDGTNIYMAMAAIFLAQATNTPLTLGHQITLLLVAMLSSKGATGVTGAGFVTLAATLVAVPEIPVESLAVLLGIDRFMSECRSITNLIGNGVATVVISRWEGELDPATLNRNMAAGGMTPPASDAIGTAL
ncbi:MAG: dicarboxylate/amino acid:cation symporter [Candidatus Methylacidiphilales bacterium]